MWISKRKRHYRAMEKMLATIVHLTYRGESIIGPMPIRNLALIAKYSGGYTGDLLETIGPGEWHFYADYPDD